MKEYSIYNRTADDSKEIAEDEALSITKSADLHTGPYGGMGEKIDQVLYAQDAGDEDSETIRVLAVHYDGEWLATPDSQTAFISFELSSNSCEG